MLCRFILVLVYITTTSAYLLYKNHGKMNSIELVKRQLSINDSPSTLTENTIHALQKKATALILALAMINSMPIQSSFADQTGTKSDKAFELCLSKCIFEETKPPPVGSSAERLEATKSRMEILKDCKKTCAKTSEQLLTGTPKKKSSSN